MSSGSGGSGGGGFGAGLGQVIGSSLAAGDLSNAMGNNTAIGSTFSGEVQPYNSFGQSFLSPATQTMGAIEGAVPQLQGYEQFMNNYQASPGAKYAISTADEAQNESAAAKGGLLSGTNERALSDINQGISGTYANQAYDQYLKGNNQQFGQLESALGNMFQAIGVGTTATGQQGTFDASQMNSQASIAAAQAKNDNAKGSGLGSMFSGLGSVAAAF
jgi:hypothetical protein